jgi:hypothetical protein
MWRASPRRFACTHLCTTLDHNHLTFSPTLLESVIEALYPLNFFHRYRHLPVFARHPDR